MTRFIAIWAVLFLVLVVTTLGTSFFIFRHIDLRYELFVAIVVTPPLQALAVMWTARRPDPTALLAALRDAWHHPLVKPVLLLDAILLSAGWILRRHAVLGLSGTVSLHPAWLGTKTIAAAIFFLGLVLQRHGAARLRAGERTTLMAFVGMLSAAGLAAFSPWVGRMSDALFATFQRVPTVLRWVSVYGLLFGVGVAVSVAAGHVLGRRWRSVQALCDAAVALSLVVAVLVVLDIYLKPYMGEPSRSLALTFGSVGATLLLIGGILVSAPPRVALDAREG